jgi:arsenate reductase (glutaredoxin)
MSRIAIAHPRPMILWHNPRCSKSRAALELLQSRGVDVQVREYLRDPPHVAEIEAVASALGEPVRTMMRTGEPEYLELHLDDPGVSDAALYAAMAGHPRLIERPIVLRGDRAVVGRPPERILELLD